MISTTQIQAALVDLLSLHAPLVTLVGDEIREENWQNANHTYPNVRFHITSLSPAKVPGNCEDRVFTVDFNVAYRDALPSSSRTGEGIAVVVEALLNEKLTGSDFVTRSGIKLVDVAGPIPETIDSWMARAFFHAELLETV